MPNIDQQLFVSSPAATQSGGETAAPAAPGAPVNVHAELMERLRSHRTLGGAPREELAWVAAHGHLQHYETGEVVSTPSRPVAGMFIVLSGRVSIHMIRGDTRHKIAEWHAGEVTGLLPYSRMVAPPGETIVDEAADTVVVARELLPEMTRQCHELTGILVHVMLDRARLFNSTMLHDEKLKSVGKLAAGLAHELNNPAAAITRFAKTLPQYLESAESASRALGAAALGTDETAVLDAMRVECLATPVRAVRSPLEDAEREAAIADWLEAHGVHPAAAEVVAQSRMTLEALERFAALVRPDVLGPVVSWVAADCAVRGLATEIEQAGTRISDLVKAVRGFTQVDATAVPGAVDLADGLGQTLTVLGAKARGKSIRVSLTIADGLPPVRGVAAELNQIWVNLIDNALDAAPAGGSVDVIAAAERDAVVVRVIDNGAGIPAEIRQQIFDPFFTTKDVGKGTGLGLDIVRRLVDRHDGDIEVQSRPGRSEFIVSLPLAEHRAHGVDA